jgi:predicted small lipoprotein YifL
MKNLAIAFLLLLVVFSFANCGSNQNGSMSFPQEIDAVYFQQSVPDQEYLAEKTRVYIEFKKPLPAEIKLRKLYFHNQVSEFKRVTPTSYFASYKNSKNDLILDSDTLKEYGNTAPVLNKSRFILKGNEAMLEYTENSIIRFYKLTNVVEKPLSTFRRSK